jgi:hypothetical protein
LWKHLLISSAGVLVAAGALWAGFVADAGNHPFGPGFNLFFDLQAGRAIPVYNAAMLLLAGHLCFLIWWARSQSWKDFSGSYRVWFWAALAGCGSAFIAITDAHIALSQTVLWFWNVDVWQREVLCWLVPLGISALGFYALLLRDMRECRVSVNLLRVSGFLLVGAALWQLDLRLPEIELLKKYSPPEAIVDAALPMLGFFCLMFALLLHARYVIYKTPEPPKPQASGWKSMFGKLAGAKQARQAVQTKQSGPAKPDDSSAARRRTKTDVVAAVRPTEAAPASTSIGPKRQKLQSAGEINRESWVDGPIDPAKLKGLSKRERRQVRKQFRDQQRAAREE